MIRRRRLLPTGIRLFTPASFIYMPTAKLPHKPFANPERKIGEKKAQSGKSCSMVVKKLAGEFNFCLLCLSGAYHWPGPRGIMM